MPLKPISPLKRSIYQEHFKRALAAQTKRFESKEFALFQLALALDNLRHIARALRLLQIPRSYD